MSKAIVVTSGKGGVGKTTLVAAIGKMLASFSLRIAMIDTDVGLNNLDVITGIENKIVYDLVDTVENRCRVSQALVEVEGACGLYVLPSAHSYDAGKLDGQSIRAVVRSLKSRFDYVLIDCPAGIDVGFHRAVAAADGAIVVTTPHLSSIRDGVKASKLILHYGLSECYLVVNRVRADMELTGESVALDDCVKMFGLRLLGAVPDDDGINAMSCVCGEQVKGEAREAITALCRTLHYGEKNKYNPMKRYSGVFGYWRRQIKKHL